MNCVPGSCQNRRPYTSKRDNCQYSKLPFMHISSLIAALASLFAVARSLFHAQGISTELQAQRGFRERRRAIFGNFPCNQGIAVSSTPPQRQHGQRRPAE